MNIGWTDAEVEALILWPIDVKNLLIRKVPMTGIVWRPEEKRTTEDEMVDWRHWLDEHEFEQAPGICEGQGGLACCNPWGCKESDKTEQLNWTEHSIANAICNWCVSPARLGLAKVPTHIPNQVFTQAQKSVSSIHKALGEFWLQGDLHFIWHNGIKDTFILLSQTTPK